MSHGLGQSSLFTKEESGMSQIADRQDHVSRWAVIAVAVVISKAVFDWAFTFWQGAFMNSLASKSIQDFAGAMIWLPLLLALEGVLVWSLVAVKSRWLFSRRSHEATQDAALLVDGATVVSTGLSKQDLVQSVVEDTRTKSELTVSLVCGLVASAAAGILFGGTLVWVMPVLSVWGLTVYAPFLWFSVIVFSVSSLAIHRAGRGLRGVETEIANAEAQIRAVPSRIRENARSAALLQGAVWEGDRFRDALSFLKYPQFRATNIRARLHALGAIVGPSDILLWLAMSPLYFSGAISLGLLFQASMAHRGVGMALDWFVSHYNDGAKWKAANERVAAWRTAASSLRFNSELVRAPSQDSFAIHGLTLWHPGDRLQWMRAYRPLQFSAGERVVLRAPSGFGKSALFAALAGAWPWGRGRIEMPGASAFVPQRSYFPVASLKEALCYPQACRDEIPDLMRDLLAQLGLSHFIGRLDEVSDWNAVLSGGEAARLSLVRALLGRPRWIFLDEPTANLDEESARRFWSVVSGQPASVVVISHGAVPLQGASEIELAAFANDEEAEVVFA
jgi:putative ATP-binding cassette transporter